MTISTVPSVLDRLRDLATAALPDIQVVDGQPHRDVDSDVFVLGFTGTPLEEAVTDTREREQLSAHPDHEQYEITCLASSWHGNEIDPQYVRNRAYEIVDTLNDELMKDQTLGGLVIRARMATLGLTQAQTDRGAVATIRLVIDVAAFTS